MILNTNNLVGMSLKNRPGHVATVVCATAIGALTLTACSSSNDPASSADSADLSVAAAFYPLEYVAAHVAGDHGEILPLTSPGIEPHDLELSPAVVREIQTQDVLLYLKDFQAAVDDAITATDVYSFDAGTVPQLVSVEEHENEADHSDGEASDDHSHGTDDPHFWLDPTLLAQYATAVGSEFATLDPDNASDYIENAAALVTELNALDDSYTAGLAQCQRDEIFVTHEAFGYLSDRYGLHQEGLSGLDPEAEPSPARVREIRDLMAADGATTVFTESLVSTNVAEALASDAGVATEVLDPVEGVVGDDDYMTVMTRNLENLRDALDCA